MKTQICEIKTFCKECVSLNRKSLQEQYGCDFLINLSRFKEFMKSYDLKDKECIIIDGEYFCKKHGNIIAALYKK